jgi:hypothetical protein
MRWAMEIEVMSDLVWEKKSKRSERKEEGNNE